MVALGGMGLMGSRRLQQRCSNVNSMGLEVNQALGSRACGLDIIVDALQFRVQLSVWSLGFSP